MHAHKHVKLTSVQSVSEDSGLGPGHLKESFSVVIVGISTLVRSLAVLSRQQFRRLKNEKRFFNKDKTTFLTPNRKIQSKLHLQGTPVRSRFIYFKNLLPKLMIWNLQI